MNAGILILLVLMTFTSSSQNKMVPQELFQQVNQELGKHKGVFAVAFKDLSTKRTLLINEHESFHAASTMKTPLLIEVYKQASAGKVSLSDSITIKNEFKSIVDGSPYSLDPQDDSEKELYTFAGDKKSLSQLVYDMITMSSNLATNLIIQLVDGKKVTASMRTLGARNIHVLRGVEDSKAFEKGLNNTTTAYDFLVIFEKLANGKIISRAASDEMVRILLDQKFNSIIPGRLPAEVTVAHKTGSINGVQHDSGIVFMPGGKKYVLVMLSKNLEDEQAAIGSMAAVSEILYNYVKTLHSR